MHSKADAKYLNHNSYLKIRAWFLSYVERLYTSHGTCQYFILLKRNHSLRVSSLAGLISKKIRLGNEDIILSKIVGLLHDVGRFQQIIQYRTFIDRDSFDHGKYGADLLRSLNIIMELPPPIGELLRCAVSHHNKAKIPPNMGSRKLLHTRIIRDADKLDILHILTEKIKNPTSFSMDMEERRHDKISGNVLNAIMNHEVIKYDALKNNIDHRLSKIAWVYDLNFTPSVQILEDRKYFSTIRQTLPNTNTMDTIFKQINSYINQRLYSYRRY
jgi:hypothetical protein